MKILRGTLYPSIDPRTAITQVVREEDLIGPLEDALASLGGVVPGALVVTEVFELPDDPDIIEATLLASEHMGRRALREANMAMLYHWDADHLVHVRDDGVLAGTVPIPHVTEDDVQVVLEQLGQHPNYRHQTVVAIAENGTIATMKDGVVKMGVDAPPTNRYSS